MTINEYLKECELFPFSKENFELIKEAAELNLAAMYIENQEFMVENASLITESVAGYMMESTDEENVGNLKKNLSEKKGKWVARANKIWNQIVSAFKRFCNAVVTRWKNLNGKAAEVKKKLTVVTLTKEQSAAIKELVINSVSKSGIPLAEKQKSGYKAIPKNVIAGIQDETVKNKLAAVLFNNSIELTIGKDSFGNALSDSHLKSLFNKITDRATLAGNKNALAKVSKYLESAKSECLSKGISVSKNMEELQTLLKTLEEAEGKFSGEVNRDAEIGFPHGVGDVTELFANAQKTAADSIKLYTTVVRYQELVINGLETILKKSPSASENKEEE